MHRLSEHARVIIERMEPGRPYGAHELHSFVPDVSRDSLREIMHELWIDRQVERAGQAGWQRLQSEHPHRREAASGEPELVRREELFDHATFSDLFK